MSAGGGEDVGPPVPSGDEQQDGKKNRVRGKKERDFAVGETKGPGDLRGDVIADGARQDAGHRAEKCRGGASLWSGVCPSREFAIQRLFTLSIDRFGSVFLPCALKSIAGRRNHDVKETYHIYLGLFLRGCPRGVLVVGRKAIRQSAVVNRQCAGVDQPTPSGLPTRAARSPRRSSLPPRSRPPAAGRGRGARRR